MKNLKINSKLVYANKLIRVILVLFNQGRKSIRLQLTIILCIFIIMLNEF